jgi:hypothetical protein
MELEIAEQVAKTTLDVVRLGHSVYSFITNEQNRGLTRSELMNRYGLVDARLIQGKDLLHVRKAKILAGDFSQIYSESHIRDLLSNNLLPEQWTGLTCVDQGFSLEVHLMNKRIVVQANITKENKKTETLMRFRDMVDREQKDREDQERNRIVRALKDKSDSVQEEIDRRRERNNQMKKQISSV